MLGKQFLYFLCDPEEDKRLKQLHYAAAEFLIVQKNFVAYLEDMVKVRFVLILQFVTLFSYLNIFFIVKSFAQYFS